MPLDALLAEARAPRGHRTWSPTAPAATRPTSRSPTSPAGAAWIAYAYEGEPLSAAPRRPGAAARPAPVLLEERQVDPRARAARGRAARLLGGQRLPPARRPLARAALRRRLTEIGRRSPWTPAEVVEVRDETSAIRTLVLDVPEWPGHRAGQSVDVRLTSESGYATQRPYSLAERARGRAARADRRAPRRRRGVDVAGGRVPRRGSLRAARPGRPLVLLARRGRRPAAAGGGRRRPRPAARDAAPPARAGARTSTRASCSPCAARSTSSTRPSAAEWEAAGVRGRA